MAELNTIHNNKIDSGQADNRFVASLVHVSIKIMFYEKYFKFLVASFEGIPTKKKIHLSLAKLQPVSLSIR